MDSIAQHKGYKFRIYPTKDQETLLGKMFGCNRFVWNHFLNKQQESYLKNKESTEETRLKGYLSYYENCENLTKLKKESETSFLKETNSQSLQSTLKELDNSYKRFFNKTSGFPNFKKKSNKQSFKVPQNIKIKDNKFLIIPKFLEGIEMVYHRPIPKEGKILYVTISKTPSGKYFASFCVEEPIKESIKKPNKTVGIDLGITTFATLSDGTKIKNPRNYKKLENQLKKQQQNLSRKQKGSRNREKQRVRVARIHEKISKKRTDFLHKTSKKIIDENQIICLETLNVDGMLKNHKLAKHIQDSGWRTFINQLEYKGLWHGRTIIKINRWFPSSKVCFGCGFKKDDLSLETREWVCQGCGATVDRDLNASKNILRQGINIMIDSNKNSLGTNENRCGGVVRLGETLADSDEASKVPEKEAHSFIL